MASASSQDINATSYASSNNVNDLKRWVWTVREWIGSGGISYTYPNLDPRPAFFDDFRLSMGANEPLGKSPYVNELEVLDYRATLGSDASDVDPLDGYQYTYTVTLGSLVAWSDVFKNDGTLNTNSPTQSFLYSVTVALDIVSDSGPFNVTTVPTEYGVAGGGVMFDNGTSKPLPFYSVNSNVLGQQLHGTIFLNPYQYWQYQSE